MSSAARFFLTVASFSGFLSVALGAFGAHALKGMLEERYLNAFHTGVQYQFYHALALLAVGAILLRVDGRLLTYSGYAFVIGTVIFSGSLYLLALTKVGLWGAVTPIGGVAFLVGWILLFLGARQIA